MAANNRGSIARYPGLETNARPLARGVLNSVRASGLSDLTSPVGEWICVFFFFFFFFLFNLFFRITTVEPLTNDHRHQRSSLSYDHISTTFRVTDSGFCSYTNPSRATIPLIQPHISHSYNIAMILSITVSCE